MPFEQLERQRNHDAHNDRVDNRHVNCRSAGQHAERSAK
jgi:hypothetical protein